MTDIPFVHQAAHPAALLYLASAVTIAFSLNADQRRLRIAGLSLAWIAVVLHALGLITEMQAIGGFAADFFSALSMVSLVIVAILLVTVIRMPVVEILPIAIPGAAAMIWLKASLSPEAVPLNAASTALEVHVIASLLAYGLLSIAALSALFISFQHTLLHRHRSPAVLGLLPPLATMEAMLFKLIAAGWLGLSVSLGTGVLFVDDLLAQHLLHKTVLSVLAWLIFGLLLAGRWRFGWRGMRVVRLSLLGMALLVLAYFGSKAVLELILHRRWDGG